MLPEYDSFLRLLNEEGFYAYYAFETARDLLLRKKPAEINILTNADISILLRMFSSEGFERTLDYGIYYLSKNNKIKFYIKDYQNLVKIPGLLHGREGYLKMVAGELIFNINAFFYDVEKEKFYDPLNSYSDLKKRLIRTVMSPVVAFRENRLLALKTARIYSETGFEIDESLVNILENCTNLSQYSSVNVEIAEDFLKILSSKRAYEAIILLDRWGVLKNLLPEVEALKKVEQDKEYHPEGDVFQHTVKCLKHVKRPNKNLMMALLLHDTGKAVAKVNGTNGKPFPNHSNLSKEIAKKVLKRFYFKGKDTQEILFLVENHMILDAVDVLPDNRLRLIFESPYISNLFEVYRADLASSYHSMERYYRASRKYKDYIRKKRLREIGIYS